MAHPDNFGEDGDRNLHRSCSQNWWLQVVASDEDTCNQIVKPYVFPYPQAIPQSLSYITSKALFHQNSSQTIKNGCYYIYFLLGWNTDRGNGFSVPYRYAIWLNE